MHALVLAIGVVALDRAASERPVEFRDTWATESLEVGTEESEPAARSPEPAPLPATPAAEIAAEDRAPAEPEPQPSSEATAGAAPPASPRSSAPVPRAAATAARDRPARSREPARSASAAASARTRSDEGARPTPGADASAAAPTGAASSAGAIGAIGLPVGTRHLATAFARALPEASHRDPAWLELPLGPVGSTRVEIAIDASGQIERSEIDPQRATPPILEHMIERVVRMLESGTFSLEPKRVSVGVERLELAVAISMRAPNPDETANPRHLFEEGREAPTRERPGRAYFTLNSGRHVEVTIRLASTQP